MQIDSTKTVAQNVLKLVNTGATVKYKAGDLAISAPTAIVPAVGNGQHNTSVAVSPAPGSFVQGDALTVTYNRNTLPKNKPTAVMTVNITSVDTHATTQAKICAQLGLVPSEVHFINPSSLTPGGGFFRVYMVYPKIPSQLYAPPDPLTANGMVVKALNTDPFTLTTATPAQLFGPSTGVRNSRNLYSMKPLDMAAVSPCDNLWGGLTADTDLIYFYKFLNYIIGRDNYLSTADLTLAAPVDSVTFLAAMQTVNGQIAGYQTYMDFTPKTGSKVSASGTFDYYRFLVYALTTLPTAISSQLNTARGLAAWSNYNMSHEKITFAAWSASNPTFNPYISLTATQKSMVWQPTVTAGFIMQLSGVFPTNLLPPVFPP